MQEDDKILKVVTRIFMAIFVVIFITIMIRFLAKNVLVDMMKIDNPVIQEIAEDGGSEGDKKIEIDWQEIYPIEEKEDEGKNEQESVIDKFNTLVNKLKTQLENYSSDFLFNYEAIVEVAKGYEKSINWNLIRFDDEQTPIEIAEDNWICIKGESDYSPIANNIVEFNNYLKEKDIELLYVQPPTKVENSISGGMLDIYKDYCKENTDMFIKNLSNNSVDVLDLREKMNEENINYLDAFYKTDHHWRPETGLWATKQITNHINQKWNMDIDTSLYDRDKYKDEIYEKAFLGSQGRKVTLAKAKAEDFNIIQPTFETNLSVEIPSLEINKTGTFRDTLIDNEVLEEVDYYNNSTYDAYQYGDRDLLHVKNNLVNDSENILLLKDSFADVVLPYLSLGVENIFEIDQRTFNGSVKSFIDKNNITKVILIYYPGSLHSQSEKLFTYE